MAATMKAEGRNEFADVAPLVKGFLAFVVRGAHRLVELHKDKEQMEILERLMVECATADKSHQPEIIETVLEILLPDDFIGGVKTDSKLPAEAAEQAESWRLGVGDSICKCRKQKGWTQDDLANAAKIPQSHVCRLEKGMHAPTHLTVERVARALGVKPSQLDPNYPSEMESTDNDD
jgi:hypothetical protein